jgi:hypothetical protein
MSDLFWLSDEQMARLKPFFPKSVEFHPEVTHLGSVFPLRFDPCDPLPTAARCGRHWSDHHGSLEPDPTSAASREAVAA